LLSAQVVLRPRAPDAPSDAEITARNIGRLEPDAGAARASRAWFEREGFAVSEAVGNSFSITGDAEIFERKLDENATGAADEGGELSMQRLPDELSGAVEAITFTRGEPLR
jgi:hypothetical protein